ncbi:MAG: M20 family metallo-hydrolase [Paludibacteraceae bacterium]|nr:M20 family metallo-hydrolase [Paludibacteraceae bacterium]
MDASQSYELLKKLIAIPSTSRDEKAVADFYERYMTDAGFHVNRVENNLWIGPEKIDPEKPTLMLNAHMDTVKPVNGWVHDPFTPTEEDGKLIGLGSNDCGGGLVSLLAVYSQLTQKEQPYNLIYAASAEEEVSGKNGMELLLKSLPKIDVALVGEPTGMKMGVAEKGLMVLDCTAHGKAGHAARNEGDNAIYHALVDIDWFKTYRFAKESDVLGPVKMSVTMINAGTQHNVIPDQCTFVVDVRTNECYTNQQVLDEISLQVFCDVKARSTRLNSSHIDLSHPIVAKGREMGIETFGSPTLSDQALMSFPSLKMGPGESSRSHTAEEYITKEEIESAVQTYITLLDGLELPKSN